MHFFDFNNRPELCLTLSSASTFCNMLIESNRYYLRLICICNAECETVAFVFTARTVTYFKIDFNNGCWYGNISTFTLMCFRGNISCLFCLAAIYYWSDLLNTFDELFCRLRNCIFQIKRLYMVFHIW